MRVIVFFFLLVCATSLVNCKKADPAVVKNLNNGNIWVIGHAGSGFQTGRSPIPSNSEKSISKAVEGYSADGIEIDVQMSKDSVLVLFHDGLMDQQTDCFGCVSEKTFAEISKCNYRQDFAVNAFSNTPVVSFEFILEKYKNSVHKPLLFLDIKIIESCNQTTPEFLRTYAQQLISILSKYELTQRAYIHTDNATFVKNLRLSDPGRKLKIMRSATSATYEESKKFALELELDGVEIYNRSVTKANIEDAHANNLLVIIFDTKDRKSIVDAIEKHPDGIMTDNIPLLQNALSKH